MLLASKCDKGRHHFQFSDSCDSDKNRNYLYDVGVKSQLRISHITRPVSKSKYLNECQGNECTTQAKNSGIFLMVI